MGSKSKYDFFWREIPKNSFSVFRDMRREGKYCDVTITVGNHSFSAHRIVLAAAVPYFRAMFRFNMTEKTDEEVCLKEIDPFALKSLIDFVYTNTLAINSSTVQSLLATSLYLQLDSVTDACFRYLSKNFSPSNVVTARAFADSVNKLSVVVTADRYIREDFDEVSKTEEFCSLPFTYVKDLISRNDLNVKGEEAVFEAVINWVKAESDRCIFLPELLQHVRFPLLTLDYTAKHVATEDLIYKSSSSVAMLNEAIQAHLLPMASLGPTARERYCKRKHHLKCAKIMGCGMYTISKTTDKKIGLYYYDPIHDKWAPMYENEAFVPFDYLVCTEHKIYFFHKTTIRVFNLKTLERTSLPYPEDFSIADAGIALHDSKIYFMGSDGVSSDEVHCFVPQRMAFSKVGKMVTHRTFPNTASLGECIYVFGGFYNNQVLCAAERYNTWSGQSTEISPMPARIWDYGCSGLNGKIYICGGVIDDGQPTDIAQVYDPDTDQWNFVAPMNAAMKSLSLVSYIQKLLAVEDVCSPNDVQIFDPSLNEWKSVKPIFCSCKMEELIVIVTNSTWQAKYF